MFVLRPALVLALSLKITLNHGILRVIFSFLSIIGLGAEERFTSNLA